MCGDSEKEVYINGKRFIDVTNQTTSTETYTYEEAYALTKGCKISTSQ